MKTAMEIENQVRSLLINAFAIINNYQEARKALDSFIPRNVATTTVYTGRSIQAVLKEYFENLAKKLTNHATATGMSSGRASFCPTELQNVCIGHIKINEYDSSFEDTVTMEAILESAKFDALSEFINAKVAKMGDEGLTMAANNIVSFFELHDGHSITGKPTAKTARYVQLFSYLSYYDRGEKTRELRNIAKDIALACSTMGIDDFSQNYWLIGNDIFKLPYGDKISSGAKYEVGFGVVTVYKSHLKTTLSHNDFDALLAFILMHKSDDVRLGKHVSEFAEAA